MKIAVIICGLMFDSQKAFMKGIERKVRDLKDICSVFCCQDSLLSDASEFGGEFSIFKLPNLSDFDGVVFVRNTFFNPTLEEKLISVIESNGIPCVCVDRYDPRFVNVVTDEQKSMFELTEHMITRHDCKKFYYVTGTTDSTDSNLRRHGFGEAIRKYSLPFKEEWVYFGDFRYQSGVDAVNYFLTLEDGLPDCIMCSNDQMAVAVIQELKKNGIKVPKNVKVTGVDFDFISRVVSPRLTTVKRQQYHKGLKAIEILHNFSDYKTGDSVELPVSLGIGESCGCKPDNINQSDAIDALAVDKYRNIELDLHIKEMTAEFMRQSSYEDLLSTMKKYADMMKAKEMYLCLNVKEMVPITYSNFSKMMHSDDNEQDYSDTVKNVIACVGGQNVDVSDVFDKNSLLPPLASGGREGVTYYFFAVHHLNRNFGYAVLGESGDLIRNEYFVNWVTTISNSFENARKLALMDQMISTLDKMWIYDTLTGIYNRAGFFKLSEPIVKDCIENKKKVCVFFLDVDGLKEVNDTYGHDEGDNLIKDVAEVLQDVKHHGEILMRYGGDEFVLLSAECDEEQAKETVNRIEAEMNAKNEKGERLFQMEASIGYFMTVLENKEQLNTIIEEADRDMYKKKYVKKALRRMKL